MYLLGFPTKTTFEDRGFVIDWSETVPEWKELVDRMSAKKGRMGCGIYQYKYGVFVAGNAKGQGNIRSTELIDVTTLDITNSIWEIRGDYYRPTQNVRIVELKGDLFSVGSGSVVSSDKIYKYTGQPLSPSWVEFGTLPTSFEYFGAIVLNTKFDWIGNC